MKHIFSMTLLLVATVAWVPPGAAYASSQASIPSINWKFLSPSEKAAVDASLDLIRHQRMKNVTLNIVDDNGNPYTGPIQVTQDSTSFVFMVGDSDWPVGGMESEYIALTPSRSMYVYQQSISLIQHTTSIAQRRLDQLISI